MHAMDVWTTGAGDETHVRIGTGGTIETTVGITGGGTVDQETPAGGTSQTGAGGIAGIAAVVGVVVRMDGATIGDTLAGANINGLGRILPEDMSGPGSAHS